jgi:hypothetical protein
LGLDSCHDGLRGERKRDCEGCVASDSLESDPPAIRLDKSLADRKSKPGAVCLLIASNEWLKDAGALDARDAAAPIYDTYGDPIAATVCGDANGYFRWRKLESVIYQICEHSFELDGIRAQQREV